MDHMMPKMDGIEAAGIIRGLGYSNSIVALTANAIVGQSEIFLQNGFDDYISKPIDTRQLDVVLNKLVRDKQPPEVIAEARRKRSGDTGPAQVYNDNEKELFAFFVRDAEKSLAALEPICEAMQGKREMPDDPDIKSYIVNVHAMKSALANIGEAKLSSLALELEKAGRERDFAVMSGSTREFLDELRKVVEKVTPKEEAEAADSDPEFLRKKLQLIQVSCETYNKKAAKDALTELKQKSWSNSTRKLLDSLSELLLYGDFEKAAAAAREVLNK